MLERSGAALGILLVLGASPAGADEPSPVTAVVVVGSGFADETARKLKEKELQQRFKAAFDALTDLETRLYKAHGKRPAAWPADAITQRKQAKATWDAAYFAKGYTAPKTKDLTEAAAALRAGLLKNASYPVPLVERSEDAVIVVTVRGQNHGCVGLDVAPGGKARAAGVAQAAATFNEAYDQALATFEWEGGWPVNYSRGGIDTRFYNRFSAEEPYWRLAGCDKEGGAEQVRTFAQMAEVMATAGPQ